jgi:hypothetical protein
MARLAQDPAQQVEEAVTRALEHGCLHSDGVLLCLRQLTRPEPSLTTLDLRGHQHLGRDIAPPDLQRYEQLLVAGRR